jgi:hypothetical protein
MLHEEDGSNVYAMTTWDETRVVEKDTPFPEKTSWRRGQEGKSKSGEKGSPSALARKANEGARMDQRLGKHKLSVYCSGSKEDGYID